MKTWKRTAALVATTALAALLAACGNSDGLRVKEVGSYHVGGRTVTLSGLPEREITYSPGSPPAKLNPNGEFAVEQMYTRYTRLVDPRGKVPMLMWHGGGLAGMTFETKPDGGPGWEMFFLRQGWDVYVSDAVERGRASWARYPEIFKTEPVFRTAKEAWELFRFGRAYDSDPAKRVVMPGTLFPIDAFTQFTRQSIPRWATNDAATQAAYDAYVNQACPCVIVVHSQGGNFAFNSALKHPDKVKAIVAVETSGSPDPSTTDFARLKHIPMLWVWGDYLDEFDFWQAVFKRQESFRQGLVNAGGRGDVIVLPQRGIQGNSHMVMMDRNSDQVAALIQQWLVERGLVK
ncbi:alpha/beta fold hydrolase [Ottowia sp.]|uniref:alpha/beta fold hydrolase n=1 Tax=Ottowia sp. TaxID=1898956 RepID=UPI002C70BBC5|nr:alpha/beta fold hydrolase [Ottowia sp.]HRN76856.1 esterase [Ottowia sp.]HRQ03916.1 esterase [Ottowia sp.]